MSTIGKEAGKTKLPWFKIEGDSCIGIRNADKELICTVGTAPYWQKFTADDLAAADLVVKAVNAHDELVAALEAITKVSAGGPHISAEEGFKANWSALMRCREIARAALSRAKGEA